MGKRSCPIMDSWPCTYSVIARCYDTLNVVRIQQTRAIDADCLDVVMWWNSVLVRCHFVHLLMDDVVVQIAMMMILWLVHCNVTCIMFHDGWVHDTSAWSNARSRYVEYNTLYKIIIHVIINRNVFLYAIHFSYLVHGPFVYILECDICACLHACYTCLEG